MWIRSAQQELHNTGYIFCNSRRNSMKLLVALDGNGQAEGELFWDDGISIGKSFLLYLFCFYLVS